MPITPLHAGPGILLKAAAPRAFSLRAFLLAQVVIDAEPAARLVLGIHPIHGPLHTYGGAAGVGLLTAVLGRYVCNAWNLWFRDVLRRIQGIPAWVIGEVRPVTWAAAVVGGLLGAVSHVWLDRLSERDFYGSHWLAAAFGTVGLVACWWRSRSGAGG